MEIKPWMILPGVPALLLAPSAQATPIPPAPAPQPDPVLAVATIPAIAPTLTPIDAIAPEAAAPTFSTDAIALESPFLSDSETTELEQPAPQTPGFEQALPNSRVLVPEATEGAIATDPTDHLTHDEWVALVTEEAIATDPAPALQVAPAVEFTTTPSPESPADLLQNAEWLDDSMAQVTSVSQLADVQPTDWAYQALQSLVERYGVIAGYADGTFRGDRPLTRYEFAAGLNAAIDALTTQVAMDTGGIATQADLETLNRLQSEFSNELVAIRGQVDTLESRVDTLESQQVSPLLRLNGEVVLGLSGADGGDPPGTGEANVVFTHLTQLQFSGSFNGRDAFRIGLSAGNFSDLGFANPDSLNTRMALLSFQDDTHNSIELSSVEYRFAVGDRLVVTLKPVGFSLTSVLSPNSLFSSSSQGAISRFAAFNPVFRIGAVESGVGFDWLMTERTRLQVAYGARDAGASSQGFFASDHRALGVQLLSRPLNGITTGIAYVNGFDENGFLNTFTGSNNADTSGGFNEPATLHAVSGTLQWQVTPTVVLGAWAGVMGADSLPTDAAALSTTYQFSLGWIDPFEREGDLLGLIVGQPPRLRVGNLIEREDDGSSMHYEAFYRFRVNDHLDITPGFFVVTNPGHIDENNTIIVGTIRSTIRF